MAVYEGGRQLSLWSATLPGSSLCFELIATRGSCVKRKADWDGKGSFIHLFLNVFVGVVCIVLFNLYVPLLITSDQFFQ